MRIMLFKNARQCVIESLYCYLIDLFCYCLNAFALLNSFMAMQLKLIVVVVVVFVVVGCRSECNWQGWKKQTIRIKRGSRVLG